MKKGKRAERLELAPDWAKFGRFRFKDKRGSGDDVWVKRWYEPGEEDWKVPRNITGIAIIDDNYNLQRAAVREASGGLALQSLR